jgi:hypothetical protein
MIKTKQKREIIDYIKERVDLTQAQEVSLRTHIQTARQITKLEIIRTEGQRNKRTELNLGILPSRNNTRAHTISYKGENWEIAFTDGSLSSCGEKAGWGRLLTQDEQSHLTCTNQVQPITLQHLGNVSKS